MAMIIKQCSHTLTNFKEQTIDIKIDQGKIIEIKDHITVTEEDQLIQAKGKMIAPGFVDVHVHLREPGGEEKETIKTGTQAAAHGGYTTICSMPNTNPVPDDKEVLQRIQDVIRRDAVIHVLPYASITTGLKGEQLVDMNALANQGAFAFTDDGVGIQSAADMMEAMTRAKAVNKVIVAHCEDNSLINNGSVHQGEVSKRLGINGIPSVCESTQIARDVLLAEATGCHYHVCHVSTKESVRVIRNAKRAGIQVTAEVSPHHLLLNETAIKEADPQFKMNPPLRTQADQIALWEGLVDGTIDFIATDHAPHTKLEKQQPIDKAPFGIVGLETAFALLHTHLVQTGKCQIDQLIDWLAMKPAEVFGLNKGKIEVGADADLVLIDLAKTWTIDAQDFYSKGKNTPFNQWEVTGKPMMTIANGTIVYGEEQMA